jgi:hypothetical protein
MFGGQLQGTGKLVVAPGAELRLSPTTDVSLFQKTLEIGGTVRWTSGNLRLGSGAAVVTLPGGTLQFEGTRTIVDANSGGAAPRVENGGLLRAGPTSVNGTLTIGVPYSNPGRLEVKSGHSVVLTSTFANFANHTLTGGSYDLLGTFKFPGADIRTNAADLTVYTNPGATTPIPYPNYPALVNENDVSGLTGLTRNAAGGTLALRGVS